MVNCSWGNTGPCLRGAFHNTTHTQFTAFFSLGVQYQGITWLAEKRGQVNFVAEGQVLHQLDVVVADELGGGGGVQVGVVCLVPHPGVHHRRWGGGTFQAKGFKGCRNIYKDKTGNQKSVRFNKIPPVVPFNSLICVL